MKRKMPASIALALIWLLSLVHFPTQAQQQLKSRPVADTGIITVAPNQLIRVTVNSLNGDNQGDYIFLFRRMAYTQANCNAGVCKHTLASQTNSGPIVLDANEAASFDTGVEDVPAQPSGLRIMVFSNRPGVRVVAQIINRTTGEVVALQSFSGDAYLNELG